MRYVAGLFDAPVPAAAGVRALLLAGVAESDVRVLAPPAAPNAEHPDRPGSGDGAPEVFRSLLEPSAARALERSLASGLTVVLARVPTPLAAPAARALRAVGAASVDAGGVD